MGLTYLGFHLLFVVPPLVSLGGFVALALALSAAPPTLVRPPDDLLAVYLVGIAVLTLPHVVVVTWMDRVQGVW